MKCRICGAVTKKLIVEIRNGKRKNLFCCASCDFSFFDKDCTELIINDRFEQERLRVAGLRIPDIKTDFDNGFRQALEYRKSYIRAVDRGKCILEIGPSWGYFLKALKNFGAKPIGLEINSVRAEFIRRNLKISCYERLEDIEEKNMKFRKIFLFYVIQYVKYPVEYISRLMRLLDKGGCLYITTPNYHDVLKDVWAIKSYSVFFYEKMTVSYYSVRSLKKIFEILDRDHEFLNIKTRQGYSFFNHIMWYFDGKPRTTGIVGGDNYAADIQEKLKSSTVGGKLAKLALEFDRKYLSIIEKEALGNQIILTIKK